MPVGPPWMTTSSGYLRPASGLGAHLGQRARLEARQARDRDLRKAAVAGQDERRGLEVPAQRDPAESEAVGSGYPGDRARGRDAEEVGAGALQAREPDPIGSPAEQV